MAFSDPHTAGLAIGALFGKSRLAGGGGVAGGGAEWAELGVLSPGAGVLVTTVVAGGIAILRPFVAASRPFLRDIIFYMVAVFLTFNALYFGRVTLAWALSKQPQRARAGSPQGRWSGRPKGTGGVATRAQSQGSFGSK